jgi:hypothetical protein
MFEVSDLDTDGRLSEERVELLRVSLSRSMKEPYARQVLFELGDQVPNLASYLFFSDDDAGNSAMSLAAAKVAVAQSPFAAYEARTLGRSLLFRGELRDRYGGDMSLVIKECREVLDEAIPERAGRMECVIARGIDDLVLLVIPAEEIKQSLEPAFTQWLVFLICIGVTALYCQSVAPGSRTVVEPVGVLLFNIFGASELARRIVADVYGIRLMLPFALPSTNLGTLGAATRATTPLPNSVAQFDMAAMSSTAAILASLSFILLGLVVPLGDESCAWVNPGSFPVVLRTLISAQAETLEAVCREPPPAVNAAFLPASPAVIAGCCGMLTTALNTLPLGSCTDGNAIKRCAPRGQGRDVLLPTLTVILLLLTVVGVESDFIGLLVSWGLLTFGVRPYLVGEPVLRDTVTEPDDIFRRLWGFVLLTISLGVLVAGLFGTIALTLLR